jgi:CheY-like chemotaxis protein/two-component sensor histidine kinase
MAKIEANKLELSPIEFCFDVMLKKVISIVSFRIEEKKQELTVSVDKRIPSFIFGDEQRLVQVLTNLLSNATKFTQEGGAIHLEAALLEDTDEYCFLRLDVIDSGIGISPEQQKKLFQNFGQAESRISRDYGGSGLGLTISKCLIELMGGGIHIESELGNGTKVSVNFKVQRGQQTLQSLLFSGLSVESLRVLVVDDSSETRSQFGDILSKLNIKYDTAASSFDAFQLIAQHDDYDMYFVGYKVSDMSGIELTEKLTSGKKIPPPVVIIMSPSQWAQAKDDAIDAGVIRKLLKPIFASDIIDCLNECLCKALGLEEMTEDALNYTGKKLLLAEDQEINREVLIALLENTNIEIDCAEDGEVALSMIMETPDKYDIVFMDVKMPRMDGIEATRRIRALPVMESGCPPIIAMTANVFADDIKECLDAGMDDHLGKPLDVGRIHDILHKYLT